MSLTAEYTPEYSPELLALVTELYRDEIKPSLGDLKLSKMLDLLEVAQWNLEQYREHLAQGNHIELLRHYIVGLLYVYVVIPNSIQFQFKNKNYELFLHLKQMYEKETNMSNVKSVTTNYITYLNDKSSISQHMDSIQLKNRPKRSTTLPSSKLEPDLTHYMKPPAITPLSTNTNFIPEKGPSMPRTHSSTDVSSLSSTNSSLMDDLWQPPELQPNDQLKLASEHDLDSTDDLTVPPPPGYLPPPVPQLPDISEVSTPDVPYTASEERLSSPPPPRLQYRNSLPTGQLQDEYESDYSKLESNLESFPDGSYREYFEPNTTHRKDSYHSVYAEDDEMFENIQFIPSKTLLEQLRAGQLSILIIDIRPGKRFISNHIPFENIINIDPSLIINSNNFQELHDVAYSSLSRDSFTKFINLRRYDEVITYTDAYTELRGEVDFIVKFVKLLQEQKINCKALRGGFDSWTKFVSKSNIFKDDLKFIVKQPFIIAAAPPSVPPPQVPVPAPQAGGDLSPKSSSQSFDHGQIQPNNAALVNRSAPYQDHPPHPPPHLVQNQSSRPYPIQQSYFESHNQAPPPPPQPQQQLQQLANAPPYPQQQYQVQTQQYQQYPVYSQSQVYGRPPAPVPRYSEPIYQHSQHQYQQYQQPPYNGTTKHTSDVQRRRMNSGSIPTMQRSDNLLVRLSITGLRNMGNTCYINAMIQCLFSSTVLRDMFLNYKFDSYFNPNFKKTRLAPSLYQLFTKMFLNGGCSIVPSAFLKVCVQLRPDLKIPTEQQDTQEFLMFLLDHLHDELSNSNAVVNDYPELITHDDLGEEYDKWNDGLIKQGLSPISKFFQGQLQDSLQCKDCGYKSSNYSTFYMLSLVIPKVSSGAFGKKSKKVSLDDCIELFTNDEVLTGDNAWDCPKCAKRREKHNSASNSSLTPVSSSGKPIVEKERKHRLHFTNGFKFRGRSSSPAPMKDKEEKRGKRSRTPLPTARNGADHEGHGFSHSRRKSTTVKSLTFVVLPPVLIIHLSRFLFYDTSQKDTAIVQYPLILEIPHKGKTVKYKLFGVVLHDGTLKSGHYTSIANKSLTHDLSHPNWFYFDDETVKKTDHGRVNGDEHVHMSSSEVYVLFYEKIK